MGGGSTSQLCANCGSELREGTRFCRICGQSVAGNDTAAGSVPAAPLPAGPVPAGPVPAGPVPAGPVPAAPVSTAPWPGPRLEPPAPPGTTARDAVLAGPGEPEALNLPGGGLTPQPSALEDTVTSSAVPAVPRWPQRPPGGDPFGAGSPGPDPFAAAAAASGPAAGETAPYEPAAYQAAGYEPAAYQAAGYQDAGYRAPAAPADYPPGGYPPGEPPSPDGGSRRGRVILAVLAVIVVAGGIAAGLLIAKAHGAQHTAAGPGASSPAAGTGSSPGSAPPSSAPASSATAPTEQTGASNLSKLLAQSVSDRGAINDAYNDVASCGPALSSDQATFRQAVTSRQALLNQLSSMPGAAALPASMISSLTQAWTASVKADQDFAAWAADESAGCTPNGSDANLSAATVPDNQATQFKSAFVASWNPIAQQYGLPTYSQAQL
jgi:hypothetical protein